MTDEEMIARLRSSKDPEQNARADRLEHYDAASQSRMDHPRSALNPKYFLTPMEYRDLQAEEAVERALRELTATTRASLELTATEQDPHED